MTSGKLFVKLWIGNIFKVMSRTSAVCVSVSHICKTEEIIALSYAFKVWLRFDGGIKDNCHLARTLLKIPMQTGIHLRVQEYAMSGKSQT